MAEYTGREWKDHLEDTAGQVIQEGTPLSAKNLNEMEQGIKQANVTAGAAQKTVQETGVEVTNIKKSVESVTIQLADTVKEVNGIKPTGGKITLPIPEIDTSIVRLKTEKISQTDVTEEFLQQMAGNTPINSVPSDNSITTAKYANESVTPNKLTKSALTAKIINSSQAVPDYNTATKVFDFKSITGFLSILLYGNESYSIPAGTTVTNNAASSATKLVFNVDTKVFRFIDWSTVLDVKEILLATFRTMGATTKITADFDITLNGIIAIADDAIPASKVSDVYPMFKPVKILLGGNNIVKVDSVAKTLTFPSNNSDTVFFVGEKSYSGVVPPNGLVVDLSVMTGTSAWVILFDTRDKTLKLNDWNSVVNYKKTHGLFATCRIANGKYIFNMDCPYILDGKYFGHINESGINIVQNPLDAYVKAIAHRGFSQNAPENTLPAFTMAKQKGFSYVEADIEWTSDGIPVLLHDDTINRTARNTDGTAINTSLPIKSITLAEAKSYDYGSWKSPSFKGTTIPTLEEFIILCKKLSLHPYIEIKGHITEEQADTLVSVVKKAGMIKNVTWISFINTSLSKILSYHPSARVGLVGTINSTFIAMTANLKNGQNEVFVDTDYNAITKPLVEEAIMLDMEVEAWTVNNNGLVHGLVEKGVSGITTDTLNIAEILNV